MAKREAREDVTSWWSVIVYKRDRKLMRAKDWDPYLVMHHAQYDGGCWHYRIPDRLLADAVKLGAAVLESDFACERIEAGPRL
jgi:hypothetical protein